MTTKKIYTGGSSGDLASLISGTEYPMFPHSDKQSYSKAIAKTITITGTFSSADGAGKGKVEVLLYNQGENAVYRIITAAHFICTAAGVYLTQTVTLPVNVELGANERISVKITEVGDGAFIYGAVTIHGEIEYIGTNQVPPAVDCPLIPRILGRC